MSKFARIEVTLDGESVAESPLFVNLADGTSAADFLVMLERQATPDPRDKTKPRFGVPGAKSMTFLALSDTPERMEIDVRGFSTDEAAAEFQDRLNEIRRAVIARRRERESKLDRAVELAERHDAKLLELEEWREEAEDYNQNPSSRTAERYARLVERKRSLTRDIGDLKSQVRAACADAGFSRAA